MKKQLQTMFAVRKQMLAYTILLVLICGGFVSKAQITNYSRTVLSGLTYTQISGGTVINSNAQLTGLGLSDDDGGLVVTLPFTFTYDGIGYTQVTFCTNGWVGMGNQTALTAAQGRAGGSLFTSTVPNSTIGCWFGDGSANWTSGGGSMVHGTYGSGAYAFEWRNSSGSGFSNSTTNLINYMIVLYGPSSATPGRIELLYGNATASPSTGRSIGIENATGGSGNFVNAINGSTTLTTTASAWPGNGNGYRFDPATIITAQPANVSMCVGGSVGFSVTANYTATTYQWQENQGVGYSNITNGGVYSGANSPNLTISATTMGMYLYQYRCVVSGNGTVTSNPAILTLNIPPTMTLNPVNSTVCEGTGTSFTIGASGTNLVYQWQENSGLGYTNLTNTGIYSGVTTTLLTLSNTTTSMNLYQYRCVVTSCVGITSTYATLTVNFKPVITSNPVSITRCSGTSGTFSVGATGTGLGYQWQLSTDGGSTWNNLLNGAPYSNVTTSTLNLTGITLSMNSYQYRCVATGTCAPAATSTAAVLTVGDLPVVTTHPSNATVCTNGNTSFSVATTGSGLSYQWQVNAGAGFNNISNGGIYSTATTNSLTITGVLAGMHNYQYRCVISSICNSGVLSNAGVLTVQQLPSVTQHPIARTICEGTNTSFSIIGSGTGISYQWQESTNGGTTWGNLINGGVYGGVSTDLLLLTGVPATMNSYQYRCVVPGTCSPTVNSNAAALTVNTSPVITSGPPNRTICSGGLATFGITATGTGLSYQWQVNPGTGFTNISNGGIYSNVTTATLTVTGATTTLNGAEYRCVVTGTCSPQVFSTGGIFTVQALPAITAHPVNATVCANGYTSFGVTATGTGLLYQWQESTNGGVTWTNIINNAIYGNAQANTLLVTLPPTTMNNYRYRCVVSGACTPTVTSNQAIMTVNSIPAITAQSALSITQCAGTSTNLFVTGSGTGVAYQWQESTNGGVTWNNLVNVAPYTNVTTATMTLSATPVTLNGFQYRCEVRGTCAPPVLTSAILLTVNSLPAITLQPISSTLCAGGNTGFVVNATGTGVVYQWQQSINSGGTWTNITNNFQFSGATTTNLNITGVTATMNNYYYRCYVSGTCPPAVISSTAILTVQTPPSLTSQPVDRTLCAGLGTTFTTSATGTSITYQWQEDRGSGYVNLTAAAPYSNVTTATLTVSPVTATMTGYKYRCVVSGTCTPSVNTFPALLTVWTAPALVSQTASVQACPGVNTSMGVSVTGSNLVYQWQVDAGLGYVAVPTGTIYSGMNGPTLFLAGPTSLQNGYMFRCIISGSCGTPVTSAAIKLTVYKPITITGYTATATVCRGGNKYLYVKALGNGLSYQWQEKVNGVYVNLQNNAPYSGVTADTMWITDASDTLHGKTYRCKISETILCNQPDSTPDLQLNVNSPIQTNPAAINVTKWGVATFTVPMGGTYYQWQEDRGLGFVDLAEVVPYLGVHTAMLRINPLSETMNGYKYRCIVDGICVTRVKTESSTLTVTPGTSVAQQHGNKLNYMSVYPNPVGEGVLNVKFDEAVEGTTYVKVLDKLGRVVHSGKLELQRGLHGSVEVGQLPAGMYTIQVYNEEAAINSSVRFTKQ